MLRKLNYLTVDWPLRQARLFPQVNPLIVEIGFGNGDYLLHLAETRPDCNLIGCEISSQSMAKAEAKIEKRGLPNCRPIHCRAETALAHLLEPETVAEFHINYPDPWFKKRHQRRRLIQRETVDLLDQPIARGRDAASGHGHPPNMRKWRSETLADTPGLTNQFERPWVL